MASSLTPTSRAVTLLSPRPCRRCLSKINRRSFTSTPFRQEGTNNGRQLGFRNQNQQFAKVLHPSKSIAAETSGSEQETMDDLGIIPNSFVLPPFKDRPWLFTWRGLLMLKERVKSPVFSIYSAFYWKFFANESWRTKLELRKARRLAEQFHKDIYTAISNRDTSLFLTEHMNRSLVRSLREKANARDPHVKTTWTIVKRHQPTISACMRMTTLPFAKDPNKRNALYQATFKIDTTQRLVEDRSQKPASYGLGLSHLKNKTDAAEGSAMVTVKEERKVEFLVMQMAMMDGKQKGWKVWGYVEPTSAARLEEQWDKKQAEKREQKREREERERRSTVEA